MSCHEDKRRFFLSVRETAMMIVLGKVLSGKAAAQEGAKGLKCSAQKPFRLRARMRQIGSLGLIHGHRKQSPANRMHDDVR